MRIKDMTGMKFGRLTVISFHGVNKYKSAAWLCKCECGGEKVVDGRSLRRGLTRSCGCLNDEKRRETRADGKHPNRMKYEVKNERLYRIWKAMKRRCYNKNNADYIKWYGSRGITVCDEWRFDFEKFQTWSMNNGYADNLSIDRIDPDGNYEPSNCRWATASEQVANRRCNKKEVL